MKLKQHFKFYYRGNGEQHSINIALELWRCPVGLNEKCTGWNKKGNIRTKKTYLTASQKVGSQSAMSEKNKEFEEHKHRT